MMETRAFLTWALALGVGATGFLDLANLARRHLFGAASPDFGLVGRWVGHIFQGRLTHRSIRRAPEIAGEELIGWTTHYAVGVLFAMLFLLIVGLDWTRQPRLAPAFGFGLVTVLAPFLIMQPAMGLGLASSLAEDPNAARLKSLISHGLFGVGLYVSARLLSALKLG